MVTTTELNEIEHYLLLANKPLTPVCLVAWPFNEREAGVDLVKMETSLLFLSKFLPISIGTASLT